MKQAAMPESGDRGPGGSRLIELRFTPEPRDPDWELRGGGAGARVGLLGWILDAPRVDDGVPERVARIVTRASCRWHLLTFLHRLAVERGAPATWITIPGGWACVLEPPTIKRVLQKRAFPLLATSDPALAEELFRAESFSWELRGQMVLLSPGGSPPPSLSYVQLEDAFRRRWIDHARLGLPADILGLLLPGVDGDFVELVAFDEGLWRSLPEELAAECGNAGVGWSIVPEAEFKETRWYGESTPM